MKITPLYPTGHVVLFKKMNEFFHTALLLAVVIVILSYLFHRGVETVAEIVVNG